jgi:non-heme chloroperoxidase
MSYIDAGTDRAGNPVNLFYADYSKSGQTNQQTAVLIHGWPLSHEMWEPQMLVLPEHGVRCVAYDRRGFGKSSKPYEGYDYDTLADDLNAVLTQLDLTDVTLVGFSMGGGEVARYMAKYNGARVSKVVLVSAVTPFLAKTDSNPDGVDQDVFDTMTENMLKDRYDFLQTFAKMFYGVSLINHPVSQAHLDHDFTLASLASPKATLDCAAAFSQTDFRNDLNALQTVPTLIIHGDDDKTVPIANSGERTAQMLPNAQYVVYAGAPHGLFVTEKERLNQDLLAFIQQPGGMTTGTSTTPGATTTIY